MTAASITRPSCSSAVPCAGSKMPDVGQIDEHADLDVELERVGVRADAFEMRAVEPADQPRLAEVHDLHAAARRSNRAAGTRSSSAREDCRCRDRGGRGVM